MDKKLVYDLCVVADQYRVENEIKQRFKKVGIEIIKFKDGKPQKPVILLDRCINFAGFPNFSDKNYSTSVLLYRFLNKEQSEGLDDEDKNTEDEPYQDDRQIF